MANLRKAIGFLARTPLHPQWLLGRRRPPGGLGQAEGRILDIGAADKWILPSLPKGAEYIALDFPATGRDLYGARPDVYADGAALPFADACMDGVVCLEVLEHVPDPSLVVAEIARVLRPGGSAWISMPFLYPLHDAPHDFQRYTEFGLRRDLARAGLQLVAVRKSGTAVATAGLSMALALAGPLGGLRGPALWLRLPFAAAGVLLVNTLAWGLSRLWPDWSHLAIGHEVEARKA